MHGAGKAQVVCDQPHALSVHELVRGQDLTQQLLATAEGLQDLGKARTTCEGNRTSGAGTTAPARHPQVPPVKWLCRVAWVLVSRAAQWSSRAPPQGCLRASGTCVPGSDSPGGKAHRRTHGMQEGHGNQRGQGAQGGQRQGRTGKGLHCLSLTTVSTCVSRSSG